MSVSACSSTAMHFLTGSAKWDFDSEVVSLGVFEKPARLWSEALAIVVREVVIVWGRVEPRPGFCGWIGEMEAMVAEEKRKDFGVEEEEEGVIHTNICVLSHQIY